MRETGSPVFPLPNSQATSPKRVQVNNSYMYARKGLECENNTPIFRSVDRLQGAKDRSKDLRSSILLIKILSMSPFLSNDASKGMSNDPVSTG